MVAVSKDSLINYLANEFKGCAAGHITYKNILTHNKKSHDKSMSWADTFGGREIIKTSFFNTQIGSDYENMVNNQREREGKETDFEAGNLSYKSAMWIKKNVLLLNETTGEYQIRGYADSTITSKNDKAIYTWSDGKPVTEEDWVTIRNFITPKKEAVNQELDKTIKPKMFILSKIESFRINGRTFV